MMNRKMKQLALAVGVALGGLSLLPEAQAVSVSQGNLGQALIFPYYTVRGGWETLLGVTNTSNQVVAVKVRFREAYNSRDVFDFNIILSPYDLWTGWVALGSDGRPVIHTEDNTCTVGKIAGSEPAGIPFPTPVSYVGTAADGGPTGVERMQEGYVEMIMMGASPATSSTLYPLASGAIHSAGAAPTGCAALVAAFQDPSKLGAYGACPTGTAAASGVSGTLRGEFCNYPSYTATVATGTTTLPLNPLKGTYALVNGAKGFNAVGLPVALQNFRSTGAMTLQLAPSGTVPFASSWHEPSLNSATPGPGLQVIPSTGATDTTITGGGLGAGAVSAALATTNIINEWSRRTNAAAGWVTATDWVITFPTKNFFVDNDPTNQYAGRNTARGNASTATSGVAATPFTQMFVDTALTTPVKRGSSCDSISLTLRNREEQASAGLGFSPGSTPQLCYEANVLTFNAGLLLNSAIAGNVIYNDPFVFGWMNIGLNSVTAGTADTSNSGLPAVGFAITSRDDSTSALLSEAALYDHSYVPPTAITYPANGPATP